FGGHEVAENRKIECREISAPIIFETEPALLRRVLTNMAKNTLEATPEGGRGSLGCRRDEDWMTFWVNNPGVMSDYVQAHIFKRSFSTKAKAGRGIGTYSMKLFTEKYLGGTIHFESNDVSGTTFSLELPLS
ncbi:MAG: HAMP domain-containing histidine kinase, partial [Candidatus Omnitrophica bacterium]|nr:HAMP domain-containing histidine kinase [Candidatus Omnitrophota bacterium]